MILKSLLKKNFLGLALLGFLPVFSTCVYASDGSFSEINLTAAKLSTPLVLDVQSQQARDLNWKPGDQIPVSAYVETESGKKEYLRDLNGKTVWVMTLGADGSGRLRLVPAQDNFSGPLVVIADGKVLFQATPTLGDVQGKSVEKVLEYFFEDGVGIKIHFMDRDFSSSREAALFARQVLDSAVNAYQTITQFQGFNSKGYSFANADASFAVDPDRVIDIYLGDPSTDNPFKGRGLNSLSFKDAPCFNTVKNSETEFEAVIFIPSNYGEFIKSWERVNPSPLGTRNVETDLRGTLIHEMLHTIIFYYNKNLNKESGKTLKADWYVEGLARYFETFAGAEHDFFSQGFKQVLVDKVRFSRGGSNFFMRYPDQGFMDLRYENALFWRFFDQHFGMTAIERLSRTFRGASLETFAKSLEEVSGMTIENLLKKYAVTVWLKDFGLKGQSRYLKEVARTRLTASSDGFYLESGKNKQEFLGKICKTDWVGHWEASEADDSGIAIAGDSTRQADVAAWATDYSEISFDNSVHEDASIQVRTLENTKPLLVQAVFTTRGGSYWIENAESGQFEIGKILTKKGLVLNDLKNVCLILTNADPRDSALYQIELETNS